MYRRILNTFRRWFNDQYELVDSYGTWCSPYTGHVFYIRDTEIRRRPEKSVRDDHGKE